MKLRKSAERSFSCLFCVLAYAKTHEMGLCPKPLFLYENQRFSKSLDFRLRISKYCDILISQAWATDVIATDERPCEASSCA